jgi:hypothetical protein
MAEELRKDIDYQDQDFRPWLRVDIRSGDITLKRNPRSHSTGEPEGWMFGAKFNHGG